MSHVEAFNLLSTIHSCQQAKVPYQGLLGPIMAAQKKGCRNHA
ncbi:hypothetical protein X740_24650 [Mesorhizobium sp. LNHC221B00]|nr:hypothetical protein X740_24650 [Mesorhizobium sp. LNHC221B00]